MSGFDDVDLGLDDAPEGVDPETGAFTDEVEEQEDTDVYAGTADFVHNYLIPTFQRPTTATVHWCPLWWEHDESRRVMRELWRSWEAANRSEDDGALAGWFRDLGYPLFDRLLSEHGPFVRCNPEPGEDYRHNPEKDMRKLTTVDPPDEIAE